MQGFRIRDQLLRILENFVEIDLDGKRVFISKNSFRKIISGKVDVYVRLELESKNISLEEVLRKIKNKH